MPFLWRQDFADLLEPKVKQMKETKEIKSWQKQLKYQQAIAVIRFYLF